MCECVGGGQGSDEGENRAHGRTSDQLDCGGGGGSPLSSVGFISSVVGIWIVPLTAWLDGGWTVRAESPCELFGAKSKLRVWIARAKAVCGSKHRTSRQSPLCPPKLNPEMGSRGHPTCSTYSSTRPRLPDRYSATVIGGQ